MRNVFIFQLLYRHVNNQTEAVVGNETVSYQAALTVLLSDHLTHLSTCIGYECRSVDQSSAGGLFLENHHSVVTEPKDKDKDFM